MLVRGTYAMSGMLDLKRKELLHTLRCSPTQQDQSGSRPVSHLPGVAPLLRLCLCLLSYMHNGTCTRYVYSTSLTRPVILRARDTKITNKIQ